MTLHSKVTHFKLECIGRFNTVVTCCVSGDRLPFGLTPFEEWGILEVKRFTLKQRYQNTRDTFQYINQRMNLMLVKHSS
jgi:hypothetical protein